MTIHMANMGNPMGFVGLDNVQGLVDTGLASATYEVKWTFNATTGNCDQYESTGSPPSVLVWQPVSKGSSLWIRCTETSGLPLTTGTPGTWQQLNSNRIFGIARALVENPYQLTYDLATDSGGSNIIDTKIVSGTVGKIV